MDEDLSGARAERKVLQALHDTQSEHTRQLREHGAQLKELQEGVDELRTGQQKVLVGVDLITRKLDSLIGDDS